MLRPGALSSTPASGSSSDMSPSFPVSSGQLSSQPTHQPHGSAPDLLHSFEGNESEQITGILAGLMAPPQYPVRPQASQPQADRTAELPSSSAGDLRVARAAPFASAPATEVPHPYMPHSRSSSHALDSSNPQCPLRETVTLATSDQTLGPVPWRPTSSTAKATGPNGPWSPGMTPKTRWEPDWRSSRSLGLGPGPSYPGLSFTSDHAPQARSIRPVDSYRPGSQSEAPATLAPLGSVTQGVESGSGVPVTIGCGMQPPSTPMSRPAIAHQQYTNTPGGPYVWPPTPARAPTPVQYPTPRPFSRQEGLVPGGSQTGPTTAADLFIRGAQTKEKGADRVLNALNDMTERLFSRMDQMRKEIRAEAQSEMQSVRDQLHALSVGQRTLATREEVAEEITSQLSPALSDFSQSMTRRTDQACAQLSQTVTDSFTDKLRAVIVEVQRSGVQHSEQASVAEKPLVELMSHLVAQLGNIGSIASSLQGLRDLPQALSDMSVFRVALDALTNKSNQLIAAPGALQPQDRAIQATASEPQPLSDEIMPVLEQLKTGLASQEGTIAQILQYMSGLAQEATELRSTLGSVLKVMEGLSGSWDSDRGATGQELQVITPRGGNAVSMPFLPTPITSGPNTAAKLPQLPPGQPKSQRCRARGQSAQTLSGENGSISRKSSTDSSSTSNSSDVFGPKRPILKTKSLNLAASHDVGDLATASAASGEGSHYTRSKIIRPDVETQPTDGDWDLPMMVPASISSKSKPKPKGAALKRSATSVAPKAPAAKRKRSSPTAPAPVARKAPLVDPATLTPELKSVTPNEPRNDPLSLDSSDSLPATLSPPPDAFVRRSTRTPSGSTDDPFGRGGEIRTEVGPGSWR